jgi:BirA family transcriptional regulator, biotin operon repressor / biotin---[acetyl-CoA-carboxylase] ligase
MSDLLAHAENLWLAMVPTLPGFTVEILPSVDSTNSELMRRARAGLMEPVLLAADEQTAGRGRMGKSWHSRAAGQSLTFSLAMPLAPADWSGLSLAVGVSLAESLHPDVRLKWPNDLWFQGRKLGGILVETAHIGQGAGAPRLVVAGIGLNIARPAAASLPAPTDPATTMAAVAPAGLAEICVGQTAGETLERVAPALARDMQLFEAQGFAPFAARFAQRDALAGLSVRLSDGTEGIARGVDATGALQLKLSNGQTLSVTGSEVSVRPC